MLSTLFRIKVTTVYVQEGLTEHYKHYFCLETTFIIALKKKQLIHTKNENKRKTVFVTTLHNNPPTNHLCQLSLIITSDLKQRKEYRCTYSHFTFNWFNMESSGTENLFKQLHNKFICHIIYCLLYIKCKQFKKHIEIFKYRPRRFFSQELLCFFI